MFTESLKSNTGNNNDNIVYQLQLFFKFAF